MSGAYCKRHEEYSHTGVCRWCHSVDEKLASMAAPATPALTVAMQATPSPNQYTPPGTLTCGTFGFPRGAFANADQSLFARCKCGTYSCTQDACPWFEGNVRHSPSGCA